MRSLSLLLIFGAIASASSDATCEDCKAVVNTISSFLTTQESIDRQTEILLAEICPIDPVPEDCFKQLPDLWPKVAMVLWPGYWNPDEEWMCATENICGAGNIRYKAPRNYRLYKTRVEGDQPDKF